MFGHFVAVRADPILLKAAVSHCYINQLSTLMRPRFEPLGTARMGPRLMATDLNETLAAMKSRDYSLEAVRLLVNALGSFPSGAYPDQGIGHAAESAASSQRRVAGQHPGRRGSH